MLLYVDNYNGTALSVSNSKLFHSVQVTEAIGMIRLRAQYLRPASCCTNASIAPAAAWLQTYMIRHDTQLMMVLQIPGGDVAGIVLEADAGSRVGAAQCDVPHQHPLLVPDSGTTNRSGNSTSSELICDISTEVIRPRAAYSDLLKHRCRLL